MSKAPSLAAQSGGLSTAVNLPSIFSAAPEKLKEREVTPYVVFAHPNRADEWAKLQSKFNNLEEGDMFLIRSEGNIALPVAKLMWLCGKQFWVLANAAGEVQQVATVEQPRPYGEQIESVVLVHTDDGVIPANMTWKTTKCPAAKILSDALLEASTPAWADRGPAFRETLAIQQPFARFFGEVSLNAPRIGKSSGKPYRSTKCVIKPTTRSEAEMLKLFSESETVQKSLDDAAKRYELRVGDLTAKIK